MFSEHSFVIIEILDSKLTTEILGLVYYLSNIDDRYFIIDGVVNNVLIENLSE